MKSLSEMSLTELLSPEGFDCTCGRRHKVDLRFFRMGDGAVEALPEALALCGVGCPFVISDRNTRQAAWPLVEPVLRRAGIPYGEYTYGENHLEPDEHALGSLAMAFDPRCDGILVVGSGVLNDVGKVFSHALRLPSLIVATAPSMDGYASDNASMVRDRVKVSLYNACPRAVIADTRVLCAAPERLLQAGLGDMVAKYLSICEWRISHLVTGEYYCENVAGLVRASLRRVIESAKGLKRRDETAVRNVMEGLLLSGIAMAFAQVSRPASGLEHYFSHMWEMMALERGLPQELHGIQVGVGSLLTLGIWDWLREQTPSRETAERFMRSFDEREWEATVRRIFGAAADTILASALKEGRNDPAAHARRLERILGHWPDILQIAREELPPKAEVERLMRELQMPLTPADIGFSREDTRDALLGSREIRNKYLTGTLLWDLGLLYRLPFPFEGEASLGGNA